MPRMAAHLLEGEREIDTEREHVLVLFPAVGAGVVGAAALLLLLQLVPRHLLGRDITGVRLIVDAVVVLVMAAWIGVRVLRWRCRTYTLTTHRIILSRGVLSRVTESIGLDRVQDTVMRRPLLERLIRAGNIEIDSAGRDGVEVLRLIPRAARFYTEILQAVENLRLGDGSAVPERGEAGYAPPAPAPRGSVQGGL
jgi:membrane protein YdbS with pleckstrin-like domain